VEWSSWPLTNNEGRSVNATSKSASENPRIVEVARGLTRLSTAKNGRIYRAWNI
jgi:hypothetical protein